MIPFTGEILRSTVHVRSGARTRWAAVLIGGWLLTFMLFFPELLEKIPVSALAGLLVYTGFQLVNPHHMKTLARYGKMEAITFVVTALGVVFIDPLEGVIIGLFLGFLNLTFKLSELNIGQHSSDDRVEITLTGKASFLNLPKAVTLFEGLAPGGNIKVHIQHLSYVDNAFYEFLTSWDKGYAKTGGSVEIEWDTLEVLAVGQAATAPSQPVLQNVR